MKKPFFHPKALIVALLSVISFGQPPNLCVWAAGADSTSARRTLVTKKLGSPDFAPTAERPVGWRGDWTGRFPGATPPTAWSRRAIGITRDIRYQAGKPSGEAGSDSHPLEYFTLKEWLVAGPYSVDDPVQGIEKDFLDGEDKIAPGLGAKAGGSTWQHLRVGIETQSRHYHNEGTCGDLNVDFVYVFGHLPPVGAANSLEVPLDKKVAYAHTYVHSPSRGQVILRVNYTAAAIKVFVNGQAVAIERGRGVKLDLVEGWNRLLVKVASGEATAPEGQNPWVSRWRFAAYLEPVLPVSYATKNIAWMTKLTGRSMSQPIIVGDRLYVGSAMTDLLCLDKRTGKILWLRSNTPYDAMTDEPRAAIPAIREKIEPLATRLNALNDETVKAINAAVCTAGLASVQQAELDQKLKAKADAERAIHDAFAAMDRKKYPQMYKNEVSSSNPAPLSDGQHVYWACGGGMKGPGAHVMACFDLNGRRVWSRHDASFGSLEHGNHNSPNLVDGKLIYAANMTLVALDAQTGQELWRNSPDDWQNGGHGSSSPLVVRTGDAGAIISMRYIHRASDGTVICPSRLELWGVLTPIVENSVVFNPCRWHGFKDPLGFIGVKLPDSADAGAKAETVMDLDGKEVTMPTRQSGPLFTVASPLYVDGVVYSVEMGGGLAAVDTVARKALYRRYLDGYNRYHRYMYGVAASPTLAGKNIYVIDDAGYTHLIEPGPQLKELGRNVIENIHLSGQGGNPCQQESFYTSPYFDGSAMYLRGEEYLYCITEDSSAPASRNNAVPQAGPPLGSADVRPSIERPVGWRGDGSGCYPSAAPVLRWSASEHVLWKSEVGTGHSSPVVVGPRVIITAEPDLLLCLDTATGKELWRKAHHLADQPSRPNAKGSRHSSEYGDATPTPVSDGKRIWAFFGTGIVACYDVDGTRRWSHWYDLRQSTSYGRTASPVLIGDRLLVHFGPLVCLDAATGKLLWTNETAKASYGTPAPARIGRVDVVITPKGQIVRVADGQTLAADLGNCMYTSPVVQGSTVYFIDGDMVAVRLPERAADQLECQALWSAELAGDFYASPLVCDGRIYTVDKAAKLYAIDATTGKTLLSPPLELAPPLRKEGAKVYPSLCLAGKHLFVSNDAGDMMLLEPGGRGTTAGASFLPGGSGGTPTFSGQRMFVRGGKLLYCVGEP